MVAGGGSRWWLLRKWITRVNGGGARSFTPPVALVVLVALSSDELWIKIGSFRKPGLLMRNGTAPSSCTKAGEDKTSKAACPRHCFGRDWMLQAIMAVYTPWNRRIMNGRQTEGAKTTTYIRSQHDKVLAIPSLPCLMPRDRPRLPGHLIQQGDASGCIWPGKLLSKRHRYADVAPKECLIWVAGVVLAQNLEASHDRERLTYVGQKNRQTRLKQLL